MLISWETRYRVCSKENWFQASLEIVSIWSILSRKPISIASLSDTNYIYFLTKISICSRWLLLKPCFLIIFNNLNFGSNYSISFLYLFAISRGLSSPLNKNSLIIFLKFSRSYLIMISGSLSVKLPIGSYSQTWDNASHLSTAFHRIW